MQWCNRFRYTVPDEAIGTSPRFAERDAWGLWCGDVDGVGHRRQLWQSTRKLRWICRFSVTKLWQAAICKVLRSKSKRSPQAPEDPPSRSQVMCTAVDWPRDGRQYKPPPPKKIQAICKFMESALSCGSWVERDGSEGAGRESGERGNKEGAIGFKILPSSGKARRRS